MIEFPQSPAEHVDLVEFLKEEYVKAMNARNAQLCDEHGPRSDRKPEQIDVVGELTRLRYFLAFARKYLDENRPAELFYPDANFGIRLTNGKTFVISPPQEVVRGSMQPSKTVPITGAKALRELSMGEGIAITNPNQNKPTGLVDMTMPSPSRDMTQAQGAKSFDPRNKR